MQIVIENADNGFIILSKDYPAKRMVATDRTELKKIVNELIDGKQN